MQLAIMEDDKMRGNYFIQQICNHWKLVYYQLIASITIPVACYLGSDLLQWFYDLSLNMLLPLLIALKISYLMNSNY